MRGGLLWCLTHTLQKGKIMSIASPDLIPHEERLLQACFRWAHADAAPYREHCLPAEEIASLAAQYADLRYPQSALYDRPENAALRVSYVLVFRCVATPPGEWRSKDGASPC